MSKAEIASSGIPSGAVVLYRDDRVTVLTGNHAVDFTYQEAAEIWRKWFGLGQDVAAHARF